MTDDDFLTAFENGTIPRADWSHTAHLHMAWLYLTRLPFHQALERIRHGIQRYNASVGSLGYHDTITVAFATLLHARLHGRAEGEDFAAFQARNSDFFSGWKPLLERHYSPERLNSVEARQRFVPPDREVMPRTSQLLILHPDSPSSDIILPPSLFLAGPTPRSPQVPSWRPDALALLAQLGFAGTVLVPERQHWETQFDYLEQVEWEHAGLEAATVIVFWVPRELRTLPGFTTNVEFGSYVGSGRVVYGRPDEAPKNRYLDWLYRKCTGQEPCRSLRETLQAAVARVTCV